MAAILFRPQCVNEWRQDPPWIQPDPGPDSICDKTSYRKISCNLEVARLVVKIIALKFDRHIGSTAAEAPVKFQSDFKILDANLEASRLHEFSQLDVLSDIETRHRGPYH